MKSLSKLSLIALLASTSASFAQEVRFGVEGGIASADLGADGLASSLATLTGRTVTYTEDSATSAIRLFAEFGLSENLGLEVGYFKTGSLDATFAFSGTTVTATVGAEAAGVDFGVKFYPSEAMFLRAGLHSSEITGTVSTTISGTTYSASASQDGTGAYIGGGVFVTENVSLGITHYTNLGGDSEADATFAFIGYRF